jgi:hypothetical protein
MADDNVRAARKVMLQKAVYWHHSGDDASGQPLYDDPVEVACRWEDVHELYLGMDGNDQVTNAKVIVDRDMVVQGQLWLGALADLTSQAHPSENLGAFSIKKFEKLPDRKAKKFLRTALL